MSKITAITAQEKRKDRCNIFVDGEFYAGVSLETVVKLRIKAGMETDADGLKEMLDESERSEATEKALFYISKTPKTKREVKDYLVKKGFSETSAWYAVDKLKEYGYIDDEQYARRFIECTGRTQGKRLMAYKLMAKGVKKEDVESAYDASGGSAKDNAAALAIKRLKNKEINKENILKTYRYLISRGFSYEEAEFAITPFKNGDFSDGEVDG